MAFRFSLATLLRLREIAEEREERLLGQIQQQIAQSRQTLVDLAERRQRLLTMREEALLRRTTAAELHHLYDQVRGVEQLQRSGEEQIAKLEALRVQQMKVFEAAHRDRELLADLREDQRAEFQAARLRDEQKMLDDNFSARRIGASRG